MKYEYRIIPIAEFDESMLVENFTKLQEWFDNGWEYVDSLTQPIAVGSGVWKSCVGVIIRKEKEDVTL